jgi:hypothetical protein
MQKLSEPDELSAGYDPEQTLRRAHHTQLSALTAIAYAGLKMLATTALN